MSSKYRNNHYVPQWYQKRFIPNDQTDKELFYLDLCPGTFQDSRGITHPKRSVHKLGTRFCFAEDDLYTRWFGEERHTDIEQFFFGPIDEEGRRAVDFFSKYDHLQYPWDGNMFNALILYLSTQKLRTPKGLGWLASRLGTNDRNALLGSMVRLHQLHGSLWTESIWQIADASQSKTKFIISDHPITLYNRFLGPRNKKWCRAFNDPDIALNATHTIFPLSIDKVLIMTNLSWVRNPYQSGITYRPNPSPLRSAIFNFESIQTSRILSEREVLEINFIIKSRALKFVAAAKEEWLYPDKIVSKSNWNVFGDGMLLMPDPRGVVFTSEIIMGWKNGASTAFDEYGRRPWDSGYGSHAQPNEFNTLEQFKGDFALKFGVTRRGRAMSFGTDIDPVRDSDEMHDYHISMAKKNRRNRKGS